MPITDRAAQAHEWRQFEVVDFEFRDDGPTGFTFEGVASVVDTPYTVRDRFGEFTETIRAGAFNKTLKDSKADVALFVNHNAVGIPLASRGSGTLGLSADPNLRVKADLNPRRNDVQDLREAVNDGIMRQMSIGFSVPKARDNWSADWTERTISEVNLIETSVVWKGANPHTSAAVRSLDELLAAADDWTPDELRRAFAHFDALVAAVEAAQQPVEDFAARDAADMARLERLRLLRL